MIEKAASTTGGFFVVPARRSWPGLKRKSLVHAGTALVALLVASAAPALAQTPDPDPARFSDQIAAFAAWDARNSAPDDALLFVGSSSIRSWKTAERFPEKPVINRGFGGSHISDVNHYIEETVLKYAPEAIVFYAGDNDIAAGKTIEEVLEDYKAFVDTVHASTPSTPIVFVSIKPSLARWEQWPEMKEANERIRSYSADHSTLHYADVATPMLGKEGKPRPPLFVQDGLHLTPAGYDLWTGVIEKVLRRIR